MIRRHATAFRAALISADVVSAIVLFLAVSAVRFGELTGSIGEVPVHPVVGATLFGLAWATTLWVLGMYRLRARWSLRSELTGVVRAAILLAVATFSVLFLLKLPDVSRLFLALLFGSQIALTFASRLLLRAGLALLRRRGYNARFVLVIGSGPDAQAFADRIEARTELGLKVIGHLRGPSDSTPTVGRPILGTVDEIEPILHGQVVDEVAVCLSLADMRLVEPISRLCEDEGKIVRIPLIKTELIVSGGLTEDLDGVPVLSLVYGPDRALGLLLKRLIDFGLAGLSAIVLSPVILAIAGWIRVVDGRPVLFRQTRVGLHGRTFQVAKFRTMVPDAETRLKGLVERNEINGPAFKVTEDPRLTRTGQLLRRLSLDELPQLWNVLRGEMSLVGPRPPLPREVDGYDVWHRRRLSMKPGMTGLWQVQARREPEFDRWVEIDLAYIDRWSLWLDFKILLRTIPAVLAGQGR